VILVSGRGRETWFLKKKSKKIEKKIKKLHFFN